MKAIPTLLSACLGLALVGGCATSETVNREPKPDLRQIAQALGCTKNQVAVCIDVDCDAEDYVCADKTEMRELFDPKIVR